MSKNANKNYFEIISITKNIFYTFKTPGKKCPFLKLCFKIMYLIKKYQYHKNKKINKYHSQFDGTNSPTINVKYL